MMLCAKKQRAKRLVNYVAYRFGVPQSTVRTLLLILRDQGLVVIEDGQVMATYRKV